MSEYFTMTPAEIIEESRRRMDRRARRLPFTETSVEKVARLADDDRRLEKEIQAEIVKMFRAYGCKVYSLSQPRETKQTPGIADLWVVHRRLGHAFWFETKTPAGKQPSDQEEFEIDCIASGIKYVCGGVKEAEAELVRIGAAVRGQSGTLETAR